MSQWGIATEMMFHRANGLVKEVDDYTVVRTPSNPDYYYGNLLLLDQAPLDEQRSQLEADFARLVGTPPQIQHRTFMWPVNDPLAPVLAGFITAGYTLHESAILLATAADLIAPPPAKQTTSIRAFNSQQDWDDWLALNLAENAATQVYPTETYRPFLLAKASLYQRMSREGRGDWYGAWLDGKQVAHLGLYHEAGTGRFQSVLTAASQRGQGICRALVYQVAQLGFEHCQRLVMMADEHYHAARLYESLGFQRRERIAGLCWWPKA